MVVLGEQQHPDLPQILMVPNPPKQNKVGVKSQLSAAAAGHLSKTFFKPVHSLTPA